MDQGRRELSSGLERHVGETLGVAERLEIPMTTFSVFSVARACESAWAGRMYAAEVKRLRSETIEKREIVSEGGWFFSRDEDRDGARSLLSNDKNLKQGKVCSKEDVESVG